VKVINYSVISQWELTYVKKDCAIKSLIDNVVLEDLVVEGLWATFSSRHHEVLALEIF
jgi:hypothetical protein